MGMTNRAEAMVTMLRMTDGEQLPNNERYMKAVKDRADASGVLLLFADEETFIEALMAAGYLERKEVGM